MANYSTGVTFNCPCGATGVPVKWAAGDGFGMKARVHGAGLPFTQDYRRGKCGGPTDLFTVMLRDAALASAGRGIRVLTRAEDGGSVDGTVGVCRYSDSDMGFANG